MGWQGVAAISSVAVSLVLGLMTIVRGSKSDQALNIATNVQSTYTAQASLIDDLQAEVARTRALFNDCEDKGREIERKYREAKREIETLKRVQAEHELTIARHQRTIDKMARRSDSDTDHQIYDRTREEDTDGR